MTNQKLKDIENEIEQIEAQIQTSSNLLDLANRLEELVMILNQSLKEIKIKESGFRLIKS